MIARFSRFLCLAAIVVAPAAAPASAGGPNGISVSVSPSRLILDGATQTAVSVTNSGRLRATIDVTVGNYAILADGRVRVDPKLPPGRSSKGWLTASPSRLDLAPGRTAQVTVRSKPKRAAAPGDHHALLLLSAAARTTSTVSVRTRVGVTTLVRVNGPLVRELRWLGISVKKARKTRLVRLQLQNRGNVNERFESRRTRLELRKGGKVIAKLRAATRSILPGTKGYLVFSYRGKARGGVAAVARVEPATAAQAGPGVTSRPNTIVIRRRVRL
jgi:hypothetical protein